MNLPSVGCSCEWVAGRVDGGSMEHADGSQVRPTGAHHFAETASCPHAQYSMGHGAIGDQDDGGWK